MYYESINTINMKKFLFIILSISVVVSAFSQNDTIFIMKNGIITSQFPANQIDSIVFYRPAIVTSYFVDPRDNHVYSTININGQIWMGENLAYLPYVVPETIESLVDPLYYVNGYSGYSIPDAQSTSNYSTYGVLYNWPAALTACPPGWHLPTNIEWNTLNTFAGGSVIAGGILKETGLSHWNSPNTGATNQFGFTALPGGYRNRNQTFFAPGINGYWWTSQLNNDVTSLGNSMFNNNATSTLWHHYNDYGFSVRCIHN